MKSLSFLLLPTATLAALTSSTQNDVTNGSGCKAMTVLFARGTTETGNMGTVAGPPFVSAVGKMMGGAANVAVQGIQYPADVPGFLAGGSAAGSKLMAQMVGQVRAACPDTALVMAGYSYVSHLTSFDVSQCSREKGLY
jgi:cutinase